jgi:S1-C subfamily serine protease
MKNKLFFIPLFLFILVSGSTLLSAAGSREGYRTELTASIIKDEWKYGTEDEKEGIYIQYNGSDPYLLAIIKIDGGYIGIYLYGPGSGWYEGDVKAFFEQTDSAGNAFNVTWFSRSGSDDTNVRAVFSSNSMFTLIIPGFFGRTDYYRKIFPYAPGFARESGGTGTGFLLNREGYVVTNFHVISGRRHILVRGIGGDFSNAYPYTAALIDEYNDIAILRPEVSFLRFSDPPYGFRNNDLAVGSSVFALGYPMRATMGNEIKLTDGIISAVSGYRGNPNEYQTTASTTPGNSGGPLFDRDGYVIGINSAYLPAANNAYYAIKIRYVLELIRSSGSRINTPLDRAYNSLGRDLPEVVSNVKNFVYMIEAF